MNRLSWVRGEEVPSVRYYRVTGNWYRHFCEARCAARDAADSHNVCVEVIAIHANKSERQACLVLPSAWL